MKRFVLAAACLVPLFAVANSQPSNAYSVSDYLNEGELLDSCAEGLPQQLACKEDFCSAMVDIRKKLQPRFAAVDRAEMITGCLTEIAVDGTGDQKTRRDRCEAWSKGRPPMKVRRSEAEASKACFAKATCKERIACWAPITEKLMSASQK